MGDMERVRDKSTTDLFGRVSALIEQTRTAIAAQADSALTQMNWEIGYLIDTEVLQEQRAGYAQEIVATLSQQLTARYGRGFDRTNLYRLRKFAQVFSDREIVATLSRHLSWSHFGVLLTVSSASARQFYIEQATTARLSVRALRELIGRQGFERREIANAQTPGGSVVSLNSFRDPYFLDFLGLVDAYAEQDLKDAMIREIQAFLLEVGDRWAFVARQKRMVIDNDHYYLDLLFYSRPLRRLIAVELKVGRFKPAHEGQMKLYLKWLDRYERLQDEKAPIGLILCTETSREQIELLEMHKDGIVVAEYWTALPAKEELERRIAQTYQEAQERVARRELRCGRGDEDEQ